MKTRLVSAVGMLLVLPGSPALAAEAAAPAPVSQPSPESDNVAPARAAPPAPPTGLQSAPDEPPPAANPVAKAPNTAATAPPVAKADAGPAVRVAPKSADDQTVRKLAGQSVRGQDGRVLGQVKDLLVDATSSTIEYAIISYGGLFGIGDRHRLVPFAALQRSGSPDEFTLPADTAQWDRLPNFDATELKQPTIAISDGERRRLAGQLSDRISERSPGTPGAEANYYTAGITQHLVPALRLADRSVYADRTRIGKVEAIVVDETARTALALFNPDSDFSPSAAKFLVPLHQLQVGGREDRLTSTLRREDLEQTSRMAGQSAPMEAAGAVAAVPAGGRDAQAPAPASTPTPSGLAPTGQTSAEQTPSAAPALIQAAQAIRSALDRDAQLRELDVQVQPEGGRLVLRGNVPDARLVRAVEETARRAAGDQEVQNDLKAAPAR